MDPGFRRDDGIDGMTRIGGIGTVHVTPSPRAISNSRYKF